MGCENGTTPARISALEERSEDRWDHHAREHELLAEAFAEYKKVVEVKLEHMNAFRAENLADRSKFAVREKLDDLRDLFNAKIDSEITKVTARLNIVQSLTDNWTGRLVVASAVGGVIVAILLLMAKNWVK